MLGLSDNWAIRHRNIKAAGAAIALGIGYLFLRFSDDDSTLVESKTASATVIEVRSYGKDNMLHSGKVILDSGKIINLYFRPPIPKKDQVINVKVHTYSNGKKYYSHENLSF